MTPMDILHFEQGAVILRSQLFLFKNSVQQIVRAQLLQLFLISCEMISMTFGQFYYEDRLPLNTYLSLFLYIYSIFSLPAPSTYIFQIFTSDYTFTWSMGSLAITTSQPLARTVYNKNDSFLFSSSRCTKFFNPLRLMDILLSRVIRSISFYSYGSLLMTF